MSSLSIIGCGWLGLPLAEKMLAKGWSVKGSTRTPAKINLLQQKGIQAFLFDLYNQDGALPDLDSEILFLNIPPGRKTLVSAHQYSDAIKKLSSAIGAQQKVIFVSSTSVYGASTGTLTEESPRMANTIIGQALLQTEDGLRSTIGDRLCILRPSGLVGPDRHPAKYLAGRNDLPNGDAPINLIHLIDVLQIIEAIIGQNQWGQSFNLAADLHPTREEYYTWAAKRQGLALPGFLSGGGAGKKIDGSRAQRELGIELKYGDPKDFLE